MLFLLAATLALLATADLNGRFVGDAAVMNKAGNWSKLHAVVTFDVAAATLDFQLSGILDVNCPNQPFALMGTMIVLPNVDNASNCIKKTLGKENHLSQISYYAPDILNVDVVSGFAGPLSVSLMKSVYVAAAPPHALADTEWPKETNTCKNNQDMKIWASKGKADFAQELSDCGHQCWGGHQCTTKCIVDKAGYTEMCGVCFGDLVGCTSDHCKWHCMTDASGPKCKHCVDENCTPEFEKCSGLTPPGDSLALLTWDWPTTTGSCLDSTDQEIWTSTGQTNFAAGLNECGHHCAGEYMHLDQCAGKYMADRFGYSKPCGTCFGDILACSIHKCIFHCATENVDGEHDCKLCVDQHCTPEFKKCSGLTPPGDQSNLDFLALEDTLATPTGKYAGSKTILGTAIDASMTFAADGKLTFDISGPLTITCPNEPYTLSGDKLTLTGLSDPKNCLSEALHKNSVELKSITYDAGSNSLVVNVDYLDLIPISFKLASEAELEDEDLEASEQPTPCYSDPEDCMPIWDERHRHHRHDPITLMPIEAELEAPEADLENQFIPNVNAHPSGFYQGYIDFYGNRVWTNMTFHEDKTFEVNLHGKMKIHCKKEPYTLTLDQPPNMNVVVSNWGLVEDCFTEYMKYNKAELNWVQWNSQRNQLQMSVTVKGHGIQMQLNKATPNYEEILESADTNLLAAPQFALE